jgi:uncharacterized protein with HEPN domain
MLDAARSVREFTDGVTANEYLQDRKLQLAIERALEIIGEAARLISPPFKAAHPEVSWQQIIAQRNVIAHDYGEIKQDRIWMVATDRTAELISTLERLLPPAPPVSDHSP